MTQDSLVVVTHGWQPTWETPDIRWVTNLCNAIRSQVQPNWAVTNLDWVSDAYQLDPDIALIRGVIVGNRYGVDLSSHGWKRVHFIAHSAGAALIEAAAKELGSRPDPPTIQETFLDPYTGMFRTGRSVYGSNADWADDYFVVDFWTDVAPVFLGWFPDSTSGQLQWAYNVDVGGTLQAATSLPVAYSSGIADSTPAFVYASPSPSHGTPIDFYLSTVNGTADPCAAGYGFPLSMEDGGSGNWATYLPNNPPVPLCGMLSLSQNQEPVRSDPPLDFSLVPFGASDSGITSQGNNGASLSADAPAWLAVGLSITNTVNFIQFDAGFTSTNGAEGLLTVYWNTNQIGLVDERVAPTGLQMYRFALPATVASGLYTLSFRLDTFNNTASSITVTNVASGFIGITQPATLTIGTRPGDRAPVITLTAAPGFNYLVQSSTDLVNWTPSALLVNTNGTVSFADSSWTNSAARFYRAVVP